MDFRNRGLFGWTFLAAAALAVTGCQHDKHTVPAGPTPTPTINPSASPSVSPSPTPTATIQAATVTTSVTLNAAGGTVSLSAVGASGTLTYPATSGGASAGAAYTLTTVPPTVPAPAPTGSPFVYFELQLSSTLHFNSIFTVSPVGVPPQIPTSGLNFVETLYDQTMGVQIGTPAIGLVSGQRVTFGPVSTGAFTANAGDVYLFVISYY